MAEESRGISSFSLLIKKELGQRQLCFGELSDNENVCTSTLIRWMHNHLKLSKYPRSQRIKHEFTQKAGNYEQYRKGYCVVPFKKLRRCWPEFIVVRFARLVIGWGYVHCHTYWIPFHAKITNLPVNTRLAPLKVQVRLVNWKLKEAIK
jgi:hypothetical protein